MDGTLIEAWASLKTFRRKDERPEDRDPPESGNPTVNFYGEKRRSETHASTTDPESRLACKGNNHEAKLYFLGHVLMENRHGLLIDFRIVPATGTTEREAVLAMLEDHGTVQRATVAADKGYDQRPSSSPAGRWASHCT